MKKHSLIIPTLMTTILLSYSCTQTPSKFDSKPGTTQTTLDTTANTQSDPSLEKRTETEYIFDKHIPIPKLPDFLETTIINENNDTIRLVYQTHLNYTPPFKGLAIMNEKTNQQLTYFLAPRREWTDDELRLMQINYGECDKKEKGTNSWSGGKVKKAVYLKECENNEEITQIFFIAYENVAEKIRIMEKEYMTRQIRAKTREKQKHDSLKYLNENF
ncbi:MAG: hypothetical protein ACP5N2_01325 [Candidatus Nanoarchaeia archaeon]